MFDRENYRNRLGAVLMNKYISVGEAAREMDCAPTTVYRILEPQNGSKVAIKMARKLNAFLENHEVKNDTI